MTDPPTVARSALPRLMFITDPARTGGRELAKVVELVMKGGCRMVQIRAPGMTDRAFYLLARQLTHIVEAYGGVSIINDRIDVCHAVGAHGVHLGADDIPPRVARTLLGAEKLLGYSAHTLKELRRLPEEGVDYFTFSPIYPLTHKEFAGEPWGEAGYAEALLTSTVPVFALGGITLERAGALMGCRAEGGEPVRIAAVSLLSEAETVMERTHQVLQILDPEGTLAAEESLEARYTYDPTEELP